MQNAVTKRDSFHRSRFSRASCRRRRPARHTRAPTQRCQVVFDFLRAAAVTGGRRMDGAAVTVTAAAPAVRSIPPPARPRRRYRLAAVAACAITICS